MEILDTASSPENGVHFSDAEITVVKKALSTKLFRRSVDSHEVRLAKFQVMITELSGVFEIPEVKLDTGPERSPGYVHFKPESNTIMTEKFLSLVTTLFGFARALHHHKPELRPDFMQLLAGVSQRDKLDPLAFALSAYKQSAPAMFEEAKRRGRLSGTSVDYTDDGRITRECAAAHESEDATGEDAPPEGGTTDLPPEPRSRRVTPPRRPTPPSSNGQRPDIDPENLRDRGNGRGED